jgi:hypothetical protein
VCHLQFIQRYEGPNAVLRLLRIDDCKGMRNQDPVKSEGVAPIPSNGFLEFHGLRSGARGEAWLEVLHIRPVTGWYKGKGDAISMQDTLTNSTCALHAPLDPRPPPSVITLLERASDFTVIPRLTNPPHARSCRSHLDDLRPSCKRAPASVVEGNFKFTFLIIIRKISGKER